MTRRTILLLTILLTVLAGCGQKGPLYQPEPAASEPHAVDGDARSDDADDDR
ncbi:LPS translocon maturation chaperone LptM [Tamilnaduibacter salinus]|nr:lipoprotein [Tamilnaduibacter salinus]